MKFTIYNQTSLKYWRFY